MVMAHVLRGAAINAFYTIKALFKFMEHFKKKRRHGPAAVVVPLGLCTSLSGVDGG
jgi:hypothetical protein